LRREDPGVKVVVISGGNVEGGVEAFPGVEVLRKPFTLAALVEAVKWALDGQLPQSFPSQPVAFCESSSTVLCVRQDYLVHELRHEWMIRRKGGG